MVERPIKKSERQAVTESNEVGKAPQTEPSTNEGAQDSITQSQAESNEVGKAPQAEPSTNEDAQDSITQSQQKRIITQPVSAKDKKKGGGRGDQRKDEQSSKPPVNLALMRGPKPTKPKPPAVKAPQEETSDSAAQAEQEET
jgi:hypothetical protein